MTMISDDDDDDNDDDGVDADTDADDDDEEGGDRDSVECERKRDTVLSTTRTHIRQVVGKHNPPEIKNRFSQVYPKVCRQSDLS